MSTLLVVPRALALPMLCPPTGRSARAGWGGRGLLAQFIAQILGAGARRAEYGDVVHLRVAASGGDRAIRALLHEVPVTARGVADEPAARHAGVWPVVAAIVCFSVLKASLARRGGRWRRGFPGRRRRMPRRRWPRLLGALAGWPSAHPAWRADQALATLTLEVMARLLFSLEPGEAAPTAAQAVRTVLAASHAELSSLASWPDWLPRQARQAPARQWLDGLLQRQLHARLALAEAAWPDDLLSRCIAPAPRRPQRLPLRAVRDE